MISRSHGLRGRAPRVILGAVLLGMTARSADAQIIRQYFPTDLPGYEGDVTLPMPDVDPRVAHGRDFRIGAFDLGASAAESVGYDSAPLGTFGGAGPTFVTGANLSLRSDWNRNALDAQAGVDNHQFPSTPLANYTNWNVAAGGDLDLGRDRVSLGFDHINQNLAPTELGVLGITAPVPYSDDDERLTATIPFSRFQLTPAFEHQQLSFNNLFSPIPLNYSFNDHQIWTGGLTGTYGLSKGYNLVATVRGTNADYVRSGGPSRNDYRDLIGLLGVDFQIDPAIGIRALVGGENRRFRFLPSETRTIPTAEIDLTWQPTRLTTVLLWFTRGFQDPTFPFASSEVSTSGRFEIEHALRRNVELRVFADVGESDYDTRLALAPGPQNSSQLLTTLGVEAEWDVNRHVALKLDYAHDINDYGGQIPAFTTPFNAIRSYNEDSATLGVTLQR